MSMFLDLFQNKKPILAMLHLKGESPAERLERAIAEADIYAACGVDAMIVEDYYGDEDDVERVLATIAKESAGYLLGVNVLDNFARSYELALQYGAKFMQVDSICGHLTAEDERAYFEMVDGYRADGKIAVIGGVRFKYQPYLSGRSLAEYLKIGMQHCDAIAVTGVGTGFDTETEKIRQFREIIGSFPLVVAAGMTKETVKEKLSIGDAAIVGSTFKDTRKDTGDVSAEHVREFMDEVARWFR
jgi:predicted TIM-barrel enzyme